MEYTFSGGYAKLTILAAQWAIADADGKDIIMRQSRFQSPAAAQDHEATVTAMSRTLEALSREITATLLILAQQARAR